MCSRGTFTYKACATEISSQRTFSSTLRGRSRSATLVSVPCTRSQKTARSRCACSPRDAGACPTSRQRSDARPLLARSLLLAPDSALAPIAARNGFVRGAPDRRVGKRRHSLHDARWQCVLLSWYGSRTLTPPLTMAGWFLGRHPVGRADARQRRVHAVHHRRGVQPQTMEPLFAGRTLYVSHKNTRSGQSARFCAILGTILGRDFESDSGPKIAILPRPKITFRIAFKIAPIIAEWARL